MRRSPMIYLPPVLEVYSRSNGVYSIYLFGRHLLWHRKARWWVRR